MAYGDRYRWTCKGRSFQAHEHAPDHDPDLYPPGARFSVDVITKDGSREIGAAISLTDAFQLSQMTTR